MRDFNIKYKDYLEKGFYGLAINNEKVIEFLHKEFQEFIKDPDFRYRQIKMKFNFCRFYSNIEDQEKISYIERTIEKIINYGIPKRKSN